MVSVITIDTLKEVEKEAVAELLVESYGQYESDFSPTVWKAYLESIKRSLDNPAIDRVLVAKSEGKLLGTLQLFTNSEAAYQRLEIGIVDPIVRLLAVSPNARGKGIAKALLKESASYAKEKGASFLYLHSGGNMTQAIGLYEHLGFKRDISKDFHNEDVHVKCFRLEL
ncbi:GNAT family N-acetyltransferase [Psychrobacillus sp. OK032]|uniref:GNAT family N-acetyltransferase n=1 Tax=Psychrobacillus sp. OK032 TaxID=1884358 RepID=UPI0008C9D662|nr:GNAT family N-acetyltransferase [Psychrobacillus sp. OK032]SER99987.1 Acetyltransferase (GNAT) family protein [Psychrobacillus sp. OK032]